MSDDIGFDFDIQTAGDTTTPATGYDISEIDLSSIADSNNMLMQIASGTGGAYAGVERTADHSGSDNHARRERASNATIDHLLSANLALRFTQNQQRTRDLQRRWTAMQDAFNEALQTGLITAEQHAFYTEQIAKNLERTQELEAQMVLKQNEIIEDTNELRARIRGLDPESANLLEKLIDVGEHVVSARLTIEGVNNGEPMRHLVHADENNRYFVLHPDTGEKLYVDEHANIEERVAALSQITAQINNNEHLANSPDLPAGKLEEFIQARDAWCERAGNLEDSATLERIGELFNKLLDAKGDYGKLEAELDKLEEDYLTFQKDLTQMSALDAEEKQQFFETRRAEIERDIRNLNTETGSFSEEIEQLLDSIRDIKNTIEKTVESIEIIDHGLSNYTDRHDQLQSMYGNWQTGWRQFVAPLANLFIDASFNQKNALEFAEAIPDHKLVQAWRDVVKDQHGNAVYRSNEDGRLYTINTETGQQDFIDDISEINRLRHEIFEKGRLTANESPFYNSPHDSFNETSQAIADADALNKDSEAKREQAEKDLENHEKRLQQLTGPEITNSELTRTSTLSITPKAMFAAVASTVFSDPAARVGSAAPMETDRNLSQSFASTTPAPASATDKPDNELRDSAPRDATLTQGQNNN